MEIPPLPPGWEINKLFSIIWYFNLYFSQIIPPNYSGENEIEGTLVFEYNKNPKLTFSSL